MSNVASETSGTAALRPLRARIPILTTPFAHNLMYYATLWPLDIEQILLPFSCCLRRRAFWSARRGACALT